MPCGLAVGLQFQRFELNLLAQQLLQIPDQARVPRADKRHRQPRSTGSPGAANAVHIVFGVERDVKVEHRRHIFDVQAARGHIGANQQIHRTTLECVQRLQTFVLALVAMQGGRLEALALQRTRQTGAAQFAVDEDKRLRHTTIKQDSFQCGPLVVIVNAVEMLLHRGGRGIGAGHLDGDRILQVAVCKSLDLGRERGRKQQRGSRLGQVAQNALQIWQEADVQHAVGFVKHHVLDLVQHTVLRFNVVQQPAWRGHQNLHALFQLGGLWLHVHAAKHNHAAQLRVFRIELDLLGHLIGQFTRGQQHQCAHRVAGWRGGDVFVFQHALQQRQRKGGGLAGAGLGGAHHVTAFQNDRNGLRLDGRHVLVAHFGHSASDGGG